MAASVSLTNNTRKFRSILQKDQITLIRIAAISLVSYENIHAQYTYLTSFNKF